ncbi:MAG: hypothetical protein HC831_27590 [Chloroflexia bacterium]|nr:hypothetical protein [Chloroflexia bacterium]
MVNLKGQEVGKYDGISYDFQDVVNGIAGVSINNRLGVIDKIGSMILQPKFEQIYCLRADKKLCGKKRWKMELVGMTKWKIITVILTIIPIC